MDGGRMDGGRKGSLGLGLGSMERLRLQLELVCDLDVKRRLHSNVDVGIDEVLALAVEVARIDDLLQEGESMRMAPRWKQRLHRGVDRHTAAGRARRSGRHKAEVLGPVRADQVDGDLLRARECHRARDRLQRRVLRPPARQKRARNGSKKRIQIEKEDGQV